VKAKASFGTWMMAGAIFALFGSTVPAHSQTLEELHKRALKEGGTVNFYGTLAQVTAVKILGVFEKRFPGIRVNQIDATPDKLAARAIAEARGGKVLADVFQTQLENIVQLHEQGCCWTSCRRKLRLIPPTSRVPIGSRPNSTTLSAGGTRISSKGRGAEGVR
jgi:hypothetical protein